MKKVLVILCLPAILAVFLLSACGSGKVAESKLSRVANPDAPAADLAQLVDGNTAFAFDLYQAIHSSDGNLVYSPYSISLAFAMAYGGARSETATQMAKVLHYSLPAGQFHPALNTLSLALARRPEQAANVAEKDRFQLNIANALWGQTGWTFLPEYLNLLAANYGAGMRLVDFQNAPEDARQQINNWVSDQTKKRIQDIIPQGMPDPSTRLVLANAIYFKATWEFEFNHDATADAPFTLLDGEKVNVPMMSQASPQSFSYASGNGWQAVALPYKGDLTEMLVIVPDAGTFTNYESAFTVKNYTEILSALQSQEVSLSMPKFTFEKAMSLKGSLSAMGMKDAFDPASADFSGMDGRHDLYIGDALHKAFIAVDEKGTEAAAATVIMMTSAIQQSAPIVLTIDRPFLFFIRDVPSGTILFMGRVLDPR